MGCVVSFGQTLEPKTFKICHVLLIAIFSMRGCVTHVAVMCEVVEVRAGFFFRSYRPPYYSETHRAFPSLTEHNNPVN